MTSKLLAIGLAVATLLAVSAGGVAAAEPTETAVPTDKQTTHTHALAGVDSSEADVDNQPAAEEYDKKISADKAETFDTADIDIEVTASDGADIEKRSAEEAETNHVDKEQIPSSEESYVIEFNASSEELDATSD